MVNKDVYIVYHSYRILFIAVSIKNIVDMSIIIHARMPYTLHVQQLLYVQTYR